MSNAVVPIDADEPVKQTEQEPVAQKKYVENNDTFQKLLTIVKMGGELFKVTMACLLVVFVPQYCPDTGTTCSMQQNFTDLIDFNKFCLAFNFFCLVTMLCLYAIQIHREWFIIDEMDTDDDKPDSNWETEREQYPELHAKLQAKTNTLRIFAVANGVFLFANLVTSAVLIFAWYYDGFRSITTILANSFLVVDRVMNCYTVANKSYKEGTALSTFLMEPLSFNTVDPSTTYKKKVAAA